MERGHRQATVADRPSRFTLEDAARRLPPGADPADRAGPSPRPTSRSTCCRSDPFGPAAGRLRAVRARRARPRRPRPRPGRRAGRQARAAAPSRAGATDSLTTPAPTPAGTAAAVPRRHRAPLLRRRRRARGGLPGGRARRGVGARPAAAADARRRAGARLAALPGRDADGGRCSTCARPTRSSATPAVRHGAARGDRPRSGSSPTSSAGCGRRGRRPHPAELAAVRRGREPAALVTTGRGRKALRDGRLEGQRDGWHLPQGEDAAHDRAPEPDRGREPGAVRARPQVVAPTGGRSGSTSTIVALPPGEFVAERLVRRRLPGRGRRRRDRPRPGPLPAAGVEPDADRRLERHRRPGSRRSTSSSRRPGRPAPMAARMAAYSALQKQLAAGRYVLPLAFPDEVVVVRDTARRDRSSGRSRTRRTDFGMC